MPVQLLAIQSLFERLAPLSLEQREAILATAEVTEEQRVELAELLHYFDLAESQSFLDATKLEDETDHGDNGAADLPGRRVGPYEIHERIGSGGMGNVYRAERRDPYKQTVAIKVLSTNVQSQETLRRFRDERQVLADLSHPNIARLLDGGVLADGRPYLVMEHVAGQRIDHYAEDQRLDIRKRVELLVQAVEAMTYAHERGVIHRDLKPSNLLVTPQASTIVLDFGLARRLDADDERTQTAAFLGTPDFMAPEQAAGHAKTASPATDVYALGAVLYVLCTGRPPFRSESTILTLRRIQEEEVLSPRRLNPAVPRDLETICLKCLEKDARRRYPTAKELAEDLRRFLNHEPVRARRIGPLGRLTRWAWRRPAVAALALALVLLTATAFVTVTCLWQTAVAREQLAVQVLDRYLEAAEARLNVPSALSEEERSHLLEAVTLYEGMLDQRGRRVGTPVQIARANIRVAKVLCSLGEPNRAIDVLTSTEALLRREMERNPNDLEPAGELLICQHRKLVAFWFSRRRHDQLALATELHADAETVARRWPNRKEYLANIALARRTYGQFLLDAGHLKRAEPILRQALQDETELQAASPHDPICLVCLASAQASLANLAFLKGEWEEYIDFNLNRLAIAERIAEVSHPPGLLSASLGYRDPYRLLRKLGRHDEAKLFFNRWSALTRKLAEKYPAIPDYRRQVGVCLLERAFEELQQEDAGADETFREYRDLLEALVRDFPNDVETRGSFALFLATSPCSQLRDLSKAKEQAEECLRRSPELVSARVALGVLACHEGSWDDAEAILSPLASVTKLNEPPIPLCASPYFVEVLCRKGRFGEVDQFLKSLHDPKFAVMTFGPEASYFDAASRRLFAKYAKAESDQAP